jgi:thioredoxin reductase
MSQYDVAIIGGGAAGLSAALVLSRACRSVLVVDAGAPRNAPAAYLHGYLSRDGLPPDELLRIGRDEVADYGGEIVEGTVTELVPDGRNGFCATAGSVCSVAPRGPSATPTSFASGRTTSSTSPRPTG